MVLNKDELVLLAHNYDMILLFIEEYGINPKVVMLAMLNLETFDEEIILASVFDLNYRRLESLSYFNQVESMNLTTNEILLALEATLKCLHCSNIANVLYLPCGHISLCFNCFSGTLCNLCNTKITEHCIIYM